MGDPAAEHAVCFAVHAERLHDDATWQRVQRFLDEVERRAGRATLFVSTLRAAAARVDLHNRLRELHDRGHEVGQHTHYYDTTVDGGVSFVKRTLLSECNVRRCLALDRDTLGAAGVRPRGFVSGGWTVHEQVYDWLAEHGFDYDCSFRSFRLGYECPEAEAGTGSPAPFFRADGLLEIPTTATLRLAVRRRLRGRPGARLGSLSYDLVYLHDYDLTDVRRRAQVAALRLLLGNTVVVSVGELARRIRARLRERDADQG